MIKYTIQIRYLDQDTEENDIVQFVVPDETCSGELEAAIYKAHRFMKDVIGDNLPDYDQVELMEMALNEAAKTTAGRWGYSNTCDIVIKVT